MSSKDSEPDLLPGEQILSDADELLWRQVHPAFVSRGRITSQAFTPTEKDARQLSVSRSALVTAERAHRHHTEVLGLASVGSYAVSVGDVSAEDLRVIDDAESTMVLESAPPGHAYIDFRPRLPEGAGRLRKIAARLRDAAEARGPHHSPRPPVVG
ncbi:hypothetical protein BCD48_12960 [Pseudofrankia sp. BMG5.36]|nr:hypothetical protein BCD48_12960 [Pseudofrankia sp. BMG5.36]